MPGLIGFIPYVRIAGDDLIEQVGKMYPDQAAIVAGAVEKALAHREVDMTGVLSEDDYEFAFRVLLREHWRAVHGEVDTWDAAARSRGVDPRPLEAAVR